MNNLRLVRNGYSSYIYIYIYILYIYTPVSAVSINFCKTILLPKKCIIVRPLSISHKVMQELMLSSISYCEVRCSNNSLRILNLVDSLIGLTDIPIMDSSIDKNLTSNSAIHFA